MHLEENRFALYREAETFLNGNDLPDKAMVHENQSQTKGEICSP